MKKLIILASLFAFSLGSIGIVNNVGFTDAAQASKPITLPDDWRQCVFYPFDC